MKLLKLALIGGASLALANTANAISPALYAKQQAAMTYGVNSNVRVVNNKVYVPTTTRFDNRAPTYSSTYQKTVYEAQSRGYSMNAAQSLAKNGPSYTSLNYPNKGNAVSTAPAKPAVTTPYKAAYNATPVKTAYKAPVAYVQPPKSSQLICGYQGANYACFSNPSAVPPNFRRM